MVDFKKVISTKVSVVILNWNGHLVLSKYLPSVLQYSKSDNVTVVVVDNASDDDSVSLLKDKFPDVEIIELDRNYGFAEGYNKGLEYIDSEYCILLNSDVRVTDRWIEPVIDYMDANHSVAACQPKIMSERNNAYFEYAGACGGFIDRFGYPFCRGRVFDVLEKDEGQYDKVVPVFWASGAAMFVRTKVFKELGGFDASFFAHMEEIDLCWRMRNSGYGIMCIPQSVVYHEGGATLSKSNPYKTYLNFRNNLVMLYKNLPSRELKQVMFLRSILDIISAMVFLLSMDLKNFQAVIRARKDYRKRVKTLVRKEQNTYIRERIKSSIVFDFYLLRKKTFSQIVGK